MHSNEISATCSHCGTVLAVARWGPVGATIPAGGRGAQYAAELRILLVYLSESLGRLGQNGGGRGALGPHFSLGVPRPPCPRRTAPSHWEEHCSLSMSVSIGLREYSANGGQCSEWPGVLRRCYSFQCCVCLCELL